MHLEHFGQDEFREWADDMSPRLQSFLDLLRYRLASAVEISAHEKALGRELGVGDMSAHNIDEWGEVLAADVFVSGVYFRAQAEGVVHLAIRCGFTGIGVYSGTTNNYGEEQVMFHLDVRPNRDMGAPATWGRIGSKWTSMIAALQSLKTGGSK